jgi:hypothetical protein
MDRAFALESKRRSGRNVQELTCGACFIAVRPVRRVHVKLAQTTQSPAATTQPGVMQDSQNDLQQSIWMLAQARDQFSSGKQGQMAGPKDQAQKALEHVEAKLNAMPQDRRAQASKSIDEAQATRTNHRPIPAR